MSQVHFYFDFSSPWAYLGATQIDRVAHDAGGSVVWTPVLIGAIFKAVGSPIVPLLQASEARRRYIMQDLARCADFLGVPLRWPSRFPMSSILPLRFVLAAGEDHLSRLSLDIYRAYWADDRDIADKAFLVELAGRHGLDGAALVARTDDPVIKNRLRENTDAAVAHGTFGLPTFLVGDELFFGQDRLDFVAAALRAERV